MDFDFFTILIVVIGIAVSIASKKSKAAQAQKRREFPETGDHAPGSASGRDPRNRSASAKTPAPSKSAPNSRTSPTPGNSKWYWPAQNTAQPQKKAAGPSYGGTPRYTHVVTSTLEGGHTHTESSMTGEESCPPPKAGPAQEQAKPVTAAATGQALLSFDTNSVLQGVLYAEILGKPKALQRQ